MLWLRVMYGRAIGAEGHFMVAAQPYAPVLVLILTVIGFVAGVLALSHVVGPRRHGRVKDDTYESGMATIGDARRRFHVQFYLLAVLFLLFDVELVFLWPWAVVLHDVAVNGQPLATAEAVFDKTYLLVTMGMFVALLLVGYVYEWRRGILRWT